MNDDVHHHYYASSRDNMKTSGHRKDYPRQDASIFSRLREFNHHALNSIGALFSHPNSYDEDRYDDEDGNIYTQDVRDSDSQLFDSFPQDHHDLNDNTRRVFDERDQPSSSGYSGLDLSAFSTTDTPTPSRPATPRIRTFDVKRLVHNFSRTSNPIRSISNDNKQQPSKTSSTMVSENCRNNEDDEGLLFHELSTTRSSYFVPHKPRPQLPSSSSSNTIIASYSQSSNTSSDLDNTPPLSPDGSSLGTYPSTLYQELLDGDDSVRPHSEEIREGKKPERAICYDTLINDLAEDGSGTMNSQPNDRPEIDDAGEWYGLEYTLELSCKERRASETYSYDESVGESSRSRESWAALRRGAIHPFFEDEDYYQWKNWHRYLDHEDEKRKHRKGLEFKARSKDLAWFYLNEMRMREVMYWQLEVYGMIGDDVKERIVALTEHRPDPYYPPKKHNLGWYLKRSRSVACLRELVPKPTPKLISRGFRPHAER